MMNKKSLVICVAGAALLFFIGSASYPRAAEAKQKRAAQKQEAVKEEKTAVANEDPKQKTADVQAAAAPETAAEKEPVKKEETEGVPTKDFKEDDFRPQVEEESSTWMFFKMLFVLGIFGGGFYYFYRFVTKKAGISVFGGEAVRVLSVVPIGQNKFLQLVDVAGRVLLVGVSDSSINLITEITEKDQVDRIRILSTRTAPPGKSAGGFQDQVLKDIGRIIGRVRELRHRDRRGPASTEPTPQDIEYLRRQRSRLKDMNGSDNE
jgi:flagellar protein FliO/FliZ